MTKEEQFERIERYIRKEMESAEQADFEAQLNQHGALKEEVKLHMEVHQVVSDTKRQAFLQQVKQVEREYFSDQQQTSSGKWRVGYWSIAASVALLLAAAVWLYTMQAKPSPEALFAANFEHYEVPATLRSEGTLYQHPDTQQAFLLYSGRKYAEAIPFFSAALQQSPNVMMTFSRGICYLATGKTREAEQDFQLVIQDKDNLFVAQANWYLALSYIKAGDTDVARQILHSLDDNRARELLQEIE